MEAPQIALLVLWAINLGLEIGEHGKPMTGEKNVWMTILALAITAAILWWGGFWG